MIHVVVIGYVENFENFWSLEISWEISSIYIEPECFRVGGSKHIFQRNEDTIIMMAEFNDVQIL